MSNDAAARACAEALFERVLTVYRAIVLETGRRIILRTPVDTGRARGAWVLVLGGSAAPGPRPLDRTGAATLSDFIAAVQRLGLESAELVNDVEYVPYLEAGWSGQAPAGMVAISVAEMRLIGPRLLEAAVPAVAA